MKRIITPTIDFTIKNTLPWISIEAHVLNWVATGTGAVVVMFPGWALAGQEVCGGWHVLNALNVENVSHAVVTAAAVCRHTKVVRQSQD